MRQLERRSGAPTAMVPFASLWAGAGSPCQDGGMNIAAIGTAGDTLATEEQK